MTASEQILRLQSLFRGNSRVIGQHSNEIDTEEKDPNKVNFKYRGFAKGPATEDHWQDHLNGIRCLGLVPINDYQEVKFMAIDVDLHVMEEVKVTLTSLCAQVEAAQMPLVVCRSKSGAAHLYCFFTDFTPAGNARKTLIRMADFFGMTTLKTPCEFFPHANTITPDSNGKYINMPYFGGDSTERYGLDSSGNSLNLDDFLGLAESKLIKPPDFHKWKPPISKGDSLREIIGNGPPCLQTIFDSKIQKGSTNDMLLQFGLLAWKADRNNFENILSDINNQACEEPVDNGELNSLIRSIKNSKERYNYNCSHPCMAPICAKNLCMSRKFGIKARVEFPVIKEVLQWGAQDEYFEIVFEKDNIKMKILAVDLFDFSVVQGLILQTLHIALPIPKRGDWLDFVTAIAASKIKRIEIAKEFSVEYSIRQLILQYATSRTIGTKLEDLLVKKPVKQGDRVFIRHKDLQEEILKRRFPGYVDGLEYSVVQNDLKGFTTVVEISNEKFAIFDIPDPKVNQEELLEKVSTDFPSQY